jgi:hypothetical protein
MDLGPSEPAPGLPWGPTLSPRQRMELAKLAGDTERWVGGGQPDEPLNGDPLLWGVILGGALRRVERGESAYARLVDLARQVGADEAAAATHLAWMRAQRGM